MESQSFPLLASFVLIKIELKYNEAIGITASSQKYIIHLSDIFQFFSWHKKLNTVIAWLTYVWSLTKHQPISMYCYLNP
jgi:hypothetical protein